ncbi:hypothetical protein GCM10009682_13390 [Luedemannella flava]|uniref:Uncharacterized protein n=1 Tax=Luedemannella flava TaxID=349316 RepID=A0ABN2LNE0_9ACTN
MSQQTVQPPNDFAMMVELMAAGAADFEPDFAAEHSRVSFADQLEGGPERARDPDSPKGLAGADDRFGSLLDG